MPDAAGDRSPKDTFITVYGRMPVLEVLQDVGLTVHKVVVAEGSRGETLDRIRALARRRGVEVRTASAHRVKVLAGNGKQDQGVLADVVAPRMEPVEDFVQRPSAGPGGSDVVPYRAPILRSRTAADAVRSLRSAGWRIAGLAGDAPADLFATDLPAATALVLGNETVGV